MKVTVLSNQSLLDLAIRLYGTAESVFLLALENDLNVTDTLVPGKQINFSQDNITDKQIVQYINTKKVHPATASGFDMGNLIFDNTFDLTFG